MLRAFWRALLSRIRRNSERFVHWIAINLQEWCTSTARVTIKAYKVLVNKNAAALL